VKKRVRLHPPKAKPHRERLHDPKPKPKYGRAKRRVMQLTEPKVAGLRVDRAGAYHVWDHGNDSQKGLAVIVQASGVKTFTAYYNFPGQPSKSMALGRVGEMTLEAARKRTGEVRAKAKQGIDPRAEDPTRSLTFGELVAVWHERELTGRKKNVSADSTMGLVKYHCGKFWNRPSGTIRYQEIDDLLCGLRDKQQRGPTAARLYAHLAAVFTWAVNTRRLQASPMQGMLPPYKVERRAYDWFKAPRSDEVLRDLWALAGELGGDRERYIKLLILTGKRRNAVQTMRWEHIDRETWLWTPSAGSATKRNNPVTLPALARRVLGAHGKEGTVARMTEANVQALQALVRKRLGLPDFVWHGVRHIVSSGLARLKVAPHIARLAMDHAPVGDVHSGYEHVDWTPEVAACLESWASHVASLVAPGEGIAVLR
jgi:integrase